MADRVGSPSRAETGSCLLSLLSPLMTHFVFFLSVAGCTFDEDSDPGLCEYRQGQEDDFDWQLIRTYNWPHPTPDLLREPAFISLSMSTPFTPI
uniref:MAM domain-containing protein n=1 Tax=Amphiprion ocellaris TaxID=80972 RepID=A0AAQ5ZWQ8_AMPOC